MIRKCVFTEIEVMIKCFIPNIPLDENVPSDRNDSVMLPMERDILNESIFPASSICRMISDEYGKTIIQIKRSFRLRRKLIMIEFGFSPLIFSLNSDWILFLNVSIDSSFIQHFCHRLYFSAAIYCWLAVSSWAVHGDVEPPMLWPSPLLS